jgi:hypothetical protein
MVRFVVGGKLRKLKTISTKGVQSILKNEADKKKRQQEKLQRFNQWLAGEIKNPGYLLINGKIVNATCYNWRKYLECTRGPGWTEKEWEQHKQKYENRCLCCGKIGIRLVPDHVISLHVGGSHSLDNIQPLCSSCNLKKGTQIIDYR